MSHKPLHIAVFGAGSIGCYLGGRLATVANVTLIGRHARMALLRDQGMILSSGQQPSRRVPPTALRIETEPQAASEADFVLMTVKSADTVTAADSLAPHLESNAVVCSFQNGLHNAALLRARLRGHSVLAGMVPYNVLQTEPGHFHQGSGGALMLDNTPDAQPLAAALRQAGLAVQLRSDMHAVQHGKFLMNLNNAINALSGLPLRHQLEQRAFRICLAMSQQEALAAFRARGITPARITLVPPALTPWLLKLPDSIFRPIAAKSLAIDAQARSSMWEDLQRGRATEIDSLQGEVVAMATKYSMSSSVSARIVQLVKLAEAASPIRRESWSGDELLAELRISDRGHY
ncbi:2-dehydropantoate 2-reductase [Streptomyces sp. NPDC053431]|uniref:2-dehydropantoate 2-reductase n=1 Tax=Streptomyces sp. NPDC053431 TaxID=3365703 RepID=UPI0037CFE26F